MKKTLLAIALSGAVLLAGCSVTTPVVTDQTTADDLEWPEIDKTVLDNHEGTYPTQETLGMLRAGMTKDQLRALIGRPHFFNGWHPRVWDYVLHFPGNEKSVVSCRMKVIFDRDGRVTHYFWKPVDPYKGACPAPFN